MSATLGDTVPAHRRAPSDRLLKIKLVCYPRWLLNGSSLSDFISHSSNEIDVLTEVEAREAFPGGPLHDYEAVVRIPHGMILEDVGRVLHGLLEKRRMDIRERSFSIRARLPRFQLIASNLRTFLHFGGSIGCGQRRWRSCPAHLLSSRRLSLRISM